MSVSLILLPLAVAAVTAYQGTRSERDADGRIICQVRTRMRDATLLAAALEETNARVTRDDQQIIAEWQGVRARFVRGEDGIWAAHFSGEVDEARAVEIVSAIDASYGRQVQRAVLQRLRDRAATVGLRLESETVTEDNSVQLVFAVEERG